MNLLTGLAAVVVAIVGASSSCAWGQGILDKSRNDEVTLVPSADPAMVAAFRKAQASLDQFLEMTKSPSSRLESVALKVRVTEGRNSEYFWITPFRVDGEGFSGTLSNEARVVRNVKNGQLLKFKRSDVVDWMYVDPETGRMHGNFTACALLTREAPQEREEFLRTYGLRCDG